MHAHANKHARTPTDRLCTCTNIHRTQTHTCTRAVTHTCTKAESYTHTHTHIHMEPYTETHMQTHAHPHTCARPHRHIFTNTHTQDGRGGHRGREICTEREGRRVIYPCVSVNVLVGDPAGSGGFTPRRTVLQQTCCRVSVRITQ